MRHRNAAFFEPLIQVQNLFAAVQSEANMEAVRVDQCGCFAEITEDQDKTGLVGQDSERSRTFRVLAPEAEEGLKKSTRRCDIRDAQVKVIECDNSPASKDAGLLGLLSSHAMLSHSDCKNVDGGIRISVETCPAHRTQMPTLFERLGGLITTARTLLTRIRGVDSHDRTESRAVSITTSTFSLIREDTSEL